MQRLVAEQMTLTVCPLSHLSPCLVPNMADHPIRRMLDLGLRATINSDDPAYFGGQIGANYVQTCAALGLDRAAAARIARTSLEASFVDAATKAGFLARLDAHLAATAGA